MLPSTRSPTEDWLVDRVWPRVGLLAGIPLLDEVDPPLAAAVLTALAALLAGVAPAVGVAAGVFTDAGRAYPIHGPVLLPPPPVERAHAGEANAVLLGVYDEL